MRLEWSELMVDERRPKGRQGADQASQGPGFIPTAWTTGGGGMKEGHDTASLISGGG